MADLAAILKLEPVSFEFAGTAFKLKRPTLVDLVEAMEANAEGNLYARAWALCRHLLDAEGKPVFADISAAYACPVALAVRASALIDDLYSEGSN